MNGWDDDLTPPDALPEDVPPYDDSEAPPLEHRNNPSFDDDPGAGADEDPMDPAAIALMLAEHKASLLEHKGAIDDLVTFLTDRPEGPWAWRYLEGPARAELWTALLDFVDWLWSRYLQYLPRDRFPFSHQWFKHPVAVEMLTALMVSWHAAYSAAGSKPSPALVDWHERALWPTLRQIEEFRLFVDKETWQPSWEGPPVRDLLLDGKTSFDAEARGAFVESDVQTVQADPLPTTKLQRPKRPVAR